MKIAADGAKNEESSIVPIFRAIDPLSREGLVPSAIPQMEQNRRVTPASKSSRVKLEINSSPFKKVRSLSDPSTNTFTSGPTAGSGQYKFHGGVLLPDGRVVFVPYDSATVGLFDPRTSATRKPAYTLSQPLPPSWNVALLPYYNKF